MHTTICSCCRLALGRPTTTVRTALRHVRQQTTTAEPAVVRASLARPSSSSPQPIDTTLPDLALLLSRPTWSVRSLVPPGSGSESSVSSSEQKGGDGGSSVTPKTLHHLLRLSALPPPQTQDEEARMLVTLSSQLHFVRAVRGVDTAGIQPLRAIRDETAQGVSEQTIGLAQLNDALALEDVVGFARRRRRRRRQQQQVLPQGDSELLAQHDASGCDGIEEQKRIPNQEEDWAVLGGASETVQGRYFVVRSGSTILPSPNAITG